MSDPLYTTQREFVERCRRELPPPQREYWLHIDDAGTRLWMTDGEDGPTVAETPIPAMSEQERP